MVHLKRLGQGVLARVRETREFDRNVQLLFLTTILNWVGQGIFLVAFNLYVLSMGIETDILGRILSIGPFAHALASIPFGLLGEKIGHKNGFMAIYLIGGVSCLMQATTPNVSLIAAAAFFGGLALAGDFVMRLPFLATNAKEEHHTRVFSLDGLLTSASFSIGSLLAGYLPNLLLGLSPDLTTRYRYTLYVGGLLTLSAMVPALLMRPRPRSRAKDKRVNLSSFLWGIDRFTVQLAIIQLFVGMTMGLVLPFMNVYFTYELGISREFFGTIAALAIIPVAIATSVGPSLAKRMGTVRAVTASHFVILSCTLALALTNHGLVATAAYWGFRAIRSMGASLWFSFAMGAAAPRAKAAASAWLDITFWLGMGIAAWVTGRLLAVDNYSMPFYLASATAMVAGLITHVFMSSRNEPPAEQPTHA